MRSMNQIAIVRPSRQMAVEVAAWGIVLLVAITAGWWGGPLVAWLVTR